MSNEQITIRPAVAGDAPFILEFIRKKAAFDAGMKGFTGTLETSEEAIRETLFGAVPFAQVLLAEGGGGFLAFALYYFRYSSFKGRPYLWLDDLFVNDEIRSRGLGIAMMRRLAQTAAHHRCTHIAWTASGNNARGIQFYERLGARTVEKRGGSLFFEADAQVIRNLTQEQP